VRAGRHAVARRVLALIDFSLFIVAQFGLLSCLLVLLVSCCLSCAGRDGAQGLGSWRHFSVDRCASALDTPLCREHDACTTFLPPLSVTPCTLLCRRPPGGGCRSRACWLATWAV